MKKITVILLAAGQSSRMGGLDKLMQPVDGIPLLRLSAQKARAVGPVFVALPPAPHPRYDVLEDLDVSSVGIPDAVEGMNASLRGALAHISQDAHCVMVLLADLPDLSEVDLMQVAAACDRYPDNLIWRGCTQDGKPGHPVIFERALFPELAELTGDSGAQSIVKRHGDKVHMHPLPGRHALRDLDTPEDWKRWRQDKEGPK